MQNIRINATKAREQFFSLLNQASQGSVITITKNDSEDDFVLRKIVENVSREKLIKRNKMLAKRTFGALKSTGYKANEFEIAEKIFVKEYKKKHGIK